MDIKQTQKAFEAYNQSLEKFNMLANQNMAYKHMIQIIKGNLQNKS